MDYKESVKNNIAEIESYKEADIEKYAFLATLDSKTCPICGNLDGKIFCVKDAKIGLNLPPMHKDCRCTTIAYMGDGEELINRRARDPETGKTYVLDKNINYSNWLNTNIRFTLNDKEIECINIINDIINSSITYYAIGNSLYILLNNNPYSWVCRITLKIKKHTIILRDLGNYETEYIFQNPQQLYLISDLLINIANYSKKSSC